MYKKQLSSTIINIIKEFIFNMKGKGRDRRQGRNEEVMISKAMSKVLRHDAVELGLTLDPSGYVPLDEIMQHLRGKGFKNIDQQRIRKIVDSNDKKRFQIQERKHHIFIRATQGHSMKEVNTQQLLTKIEDPSIYPIVIHGTYFKFWHLIKPEGLKRMTRNHIHFAPGLPKEEGVISGMRSNCDIIIEIDMQAAMKDGIVFYISSNNVILTEGENGVLKSKYFKKVMKKDGTIIQNKELPILNEKKENFDTVDKVEKENEEEQKPQILQFKKKIEQ